MTRDTAITPINGRCMSRTFSAKKMLVTTESASSGGRINGPKKRVLAHISAAESDVTNSAVISYNFNRILTS